MVQFEIGANTKHIELVERITTDYGPFARRVGTVCKRRLPYRSEITGCVFNRGVAAFNPLDAVLITPKLPARHSLPAIQIPIASTDCVTPRC